MSYVWWSDGPSTRSSSSPHCIHLLFTTPILYQAGDQSEGPEMGGRRGWGRGWGVFADKQLLRPQIIRAQELSQSLGGRPEPAPRP